MEFLKNNMINFNINSAYKFIGLSIIILFNNFFVAYSQYRPSSDKMNYYNLGKKFYTEVHFIPSQSKDSIFALTFYRFTYDLISFEKSGILNSAIQNFYAIPKLEIEFKDSEGIIRHREVWQDTIFSDDFEKTISKSDYIYGAIESKLSINSYNIEIRLSDKNIQTIKKISIKDSIKNFYNDAVISKPFFVEINKNDNHVFKPFILKNKIDFTSKNSGILIPVSFKDEFSKFNYSCKFIESNKKNEFRWKSKFNINSVVIPEKNSTISLCTNNIDGIEISTKPITADVSVKLDENINTYSEKLPEAKILTGVLHISLPIEEIVPGEYELKVVETGSKDTMTYYFEVVWEGVPVILQKPKYAIESMYYILTDEEYNKMLDADSDEYSSEIINYWKKQDPSKFTPYNESMAEYFRRVDFAIFNFKTINEANGVKTDRGKIYILYGPATSTERNLKENKAFEIWKYEHLKKIFIFETLANDVFKLIDIKSY